MADVLGDAMPDVLGEVMALLLGEANALELGDAIPAVLGDPIPEVLGDPKPRALKVPLAAPGDPKPVAFTEPVPAELGDDIQEALGDAIPRLLGDGMPDVLGAFMERLLGVGAGAPVWAKQEIENAAQIDIRMVRRMTHLSLIYIGTLQPAIHRDKNTNGLDCADSACAHRKFLALTQHLYRAGIRTVPEPMSVSIIPSPSVSGVVEVPD